MISFDVDLTILVVSRLVFIDLKELRLNLSWGRLTWVLAAVELYP